MNIDEITRIAELMTAHNLAEFVIESPEIKLSLKRSGGHAETTVPVVPAPVAAPASATHMPDPAVVPAAAVAAKPAEKIISIDSPIVGTFYLAPAPDAPPFVKVGDKVNEDTVVCIVEAMKVMNEVKAEKRGVIRRVLVENAKPVEFGQPLFELDEE